MPQAVWIGELSFGLVNMPVKLYAATSPKRVQFHQYEAGTGRRIRYRRVVEGPTSEDDWSLPREAETAPAKPDPPVNGPADEAIAGLGAAALPEDTRDEAEVPWEQIVRGYEVEPGRVVTVDDEELESVAPERSRTLEVEQFVDLSDVDPVHFEKSYYVVPQPGAGAERPYWLLYRALEKAARVAVGRFVLRTKEYLAIVRPAEHVLMLETLFYPDEVRDPKEVWYPSIEEPSERELRAAQLLLDALAGDWEPARQRDEHRARVLDLIHSKAGEALTPPDSGEEPPITPAIDLMEALLASVEAAKQARANEEKRTG
jgi:DNA end-binding protein Ku